MTAFTTFGTQHLLRTTVDLWVIVRLVGRVRCLPAWPARQGLMNGLMNISFPHDNGPDILTMIKSKYMASFDSGVEYFDGIVKEALGSNEKAESAEIDREELRPFRGSAFAREFLIK